MSTDLHDRITDGLHRLAGSIAAPPTPATREEIDRRTARLHHRHHTARLVLSAAVVVLLMAAGFAVLRNDGEPADDVVAGRPDEAADGPWSEPPPGTGTLPIFTVEGAETFQAWEGPILDPSFPNGPLYSLQVFHQPGDYDGPRASVVYTAPCDAPALDQPGVPCGANIPTLPEEPPTSVVGEAELWAYEPDGILYGATLADRGKLTISAWGLSADEVVAFAEGLRRPESVGFEATVLPQGISAQDVTPRQAGRTGRYHTSEEISITVEPGGADVLEHRLASLYYVERIERITVLGRPAVLVRTRPIDYGPRDTQTWRLIWRHTEDAVVEVGFGDTDRGSVQSRIQALRELDEDEWQHLVAAHTLVEVPNVVGLDEDAARDELEAAGFSISWTAQPTADPTQVGMVIAQNPLGAEAVRGGIVTIVVGAG